MHQIQLKTGLGKSTIGRINKEVDLNKGKNRGGHSSKLSCCNKQTIICQITTGKLDNDAVQVTNFINNIISSPVTPQNHSRKTTFTLLSSKNTLSLKRPIDRIILNLLNITKTGLQRIGKGSCDIPVFKPAWRFFS